MRIKNNKTNKVLLTILMVAMIFSFSCKKQTIEDDKKITDKSENKSTEDNAIKYTSQIIDVDSNIYKTITIGTQEWMAKNLNVEHYQNGDAIPQVQDNEKWNNLTTGGWCYYENKTENGKIYGKLYNRYAILDKRGITPKGWHIPSKKEWIKLIDFLGGDSLAGRKMKVSTFSNELLSNESGFSAVPAGIRTSQGYFYKGYSFHTNDWVATWGQVSPLIIELSEYSSEVSFNYSNKTDGYSVRCVKD